MCAGRASFWIAAIGLMFACRALAYDGPLVDGHAHWGDSFDTRAVIERYRCLDVVDDHLEDPVVALARVQDLDAIHRNHLQFGGQGAHAALRTRVRAAMP